MRKVSENKYSYFKKYTFLSVVAWTILVVFLLSLELSLHKDELETIAIHEAEAAYQNDLQYRRWNAKHGGVYVPVTEETPSNPYLRDVPEQDLTTPSGRKLTLMNPAYMVRQVHELGRKQPGIWGHITSLKPLNPGNAPDAWEQKGLLSFERGVKEVSFVQPLEGKQYLRFMRPLITEESCLKCHAVQGYRKGDVRGGISITVPLHNFWSISYMSMWDNVGSYGLLWLTGVIAIVMGSGRLREKTARLIDEQNKYHVLFNTAHDAVFISDSETGIILDANKKACELVGRPAEAMIGRDLLELHPDEDKQRCAELFRKVVESGECCSEDIFISGNNGRSIPIELSGAFSKTQGKNIVQFLYKDITEHKKAEIEKENLINELQNLITQISNSQREWQETFDSIPDVIFISDMECNIIRTNRAIENLLSLPLKTILHQKCHSLFQWMYPVPESCSSCVCVKSGLPSTTENFDAKLNRSFEVTVLPKHDSNFETIGLIHIVRDITERKKLQEQLAQAQKMEAVGQLAGGVAHDFNNVLTAIISCSSLINIKLDSGSPLRKYIEHILDSSRRGATLVKGLLTFSRKQIFYPVLLDLNDLVRGVEELLRRTITEEIELRVVISDDVLTIMADKTSLEQVLINLVANARDAMPLGGTITIRTDLLELDSAFAEMHGPLKPGRYAFLSVSDTGEGIPENVKARVFEPFFTTKEVGKGTGLGLSIIYGIVQQHEGHISLDSMPEIGTNMMLYLPLQIEDDNQVVEEENLLPEGGRETLLLVEDDANMRDITQKLLEDFGYTVMAAGDGEEALRMFFEQKDSIRLVVIDIVMPKMNGKEVSEVIKKVWPEIKTIFISGYAADVLQGSFIFDEEAHFIPKPISPVRFLKKVREVLDA